MRVKCKATVGLCALLLGGVAGAQAAQPSAVKDAPGWQIGAETDAAGRLAQCRVASNTAGHAVLAFTMNRDRKTGIAVSDKNWAPQGERETIRIAIDRGTLTPTDASVAAGGYAFGVPVLPGFAEALASGRELIVQVGKHKEAFPLRGSRKALAALAACVDQALAAEPKAPPVPVAAPAAAPAPAPAAVPVAAPEPAPATVVAPAPEPTAPPAAEPAPAVAAPAPATAPEPAPATVAAPEPAAAEPAPAAPTAAEPAPPAPVVAAPAPLPVEPAPADPAPAAVATPAEPASAVPATPVEPVVAAPAAPVAPAAEPAPAPAATAASSVEAAPAQGGASAAVTAEPAPAAPAIPVTEPAPGTPAAEPAKQ